MEGFSLIEILIALMIVAFGALIGTNLTMTSAKNLAYDRDTVTANEIASNVMEELLERNSNDPDLTPGIHSYYYDQTEKLAASPSPYSAIWSTTWNTPAPNMMDIKLQVTWIYSGTNHALSFETFRSSK